MEKKGTKLAEWVLDGGKQRFLGVYLPLFFLFMEYFSILRDSSAGLTKLKAYASLSSSST